MPSSVMTLTMAPPHRCHSLPGAHAGFIGLGSSGPASYKTCTSVIFISRIPPFGFASQNSATPSSPRAVRSRRARVSRKLPPLLANSPLPDVTRFHARAPGCVLDVRRAGLVYVDGNRRTAAFRGAHHFSNPVLSQSDRIGCRRGSSATYRLEADQDKRLR